MREVVNTMQFNDFHLCICFFPCLPNCSLFYRFIIFKISCREIPKAVARFYGSAADQYLVLVNRQTTYYKLGVLVINHSTLLTDKASAIISFGDFKLYLVTATITTVVHFSGFEIKLLKKIVWHDIKKNLLE